jgi:recombination protein RecT
MAETSLVNSPNNKPAFSSFMTSNAVQKRIGAMVAGDGGPRFISSVVSAVSVNPALAECDYGTILSAALLGESLKLSPSPQLGQYYMVPFNDKKRNNKVAQFQLGYKGYIQLAIRSGQYKKLNVLAIKKGELVRYDPLNEEIEVALIMDEEKREITETIGYYAMFELTNGFRKTMYWSREKMMAHADRYSMAFNASVYQKILDGKIPQGDMWKYSSFWYKDFDGMAYKTMLRQLISKWGVMSIDLQTAINQDMAVTYGDGSVEYVDNSADFAQGAFDTPAVATLDAPRDEIPVGGENTKANAKAATGAGTGRQVSMNDL